MIVFRQTRDETKKRIAQLDEHKLKCTLTRTLSPLNAINLRRAHSLVESGHMIGKVVITNEKA